MRCQIFNPNLYELCFVMYERNRICFAFKKPSPKEKIWYTLPINFKLPDEQKVIDEALPKSE